MMPMTPTWVLGIDPGGMTGWALITDTSDPLGTLTASQAPPDEFLSRLRTWLDSVSEHSGLLAVERFVVTTQTAKMSPQYDALETIGVVKYLSRQYDVPYVLQTPAQAKRFATNKHLKLWGVYNTKVPHGMDGARHALFALMNLGEREWYQPLERS